VTTNPSTAPGARRLLILLLGGRIQPAAMTAFQLQPDVAACIVSQDTAGVADNMTDLLRRRFPEMQIAAAQAVSAIAPNATRQAVESLLQQYPDCAPTVSLTGAPVPMTLGAYEAARTHGIPAYYLPSNESTLLDVAGEGKREQVALRLDLPDFLLVHGLRMVTAGNYQAKVPARFKQAITHFQRDFAVASELLKWLTGKGMTHSVRQRAWPLGDAHRALLVQLAAVGVIRRLAWARSESGSTVEYQVSDAECMKFLSGGWLEQYVYLAAHIKPPGAGALFDHMAYGLELQSNVAQKAAGGAKQATREIDFIGLRQNAPLIASIKTVERFWQKAYLDELVAVGNLLGGSYCTKLFVTDQPMPKGIERKERDWPKAAQQFLAHAQDARVVVVTGETLGSIKQVLARQAIKPTDARK
jgi:hypothetical protein